MHLLYSKPATSWSMYFCCFPLLDSQPICNKFHSSHKWLWIGREQSEDKSTISPLAERQSRRQLLLLDVVGRRRWWPRVRRCVEIPSGTTVHFTGIAEQKDRAPHRVTSGKMNFHFSFSIPGEVQRTAQIWSCVWILDFSEFEFPYHKHKLVSICLSRGCQQHFLPLLATSFQFVSSRVIVEGWLDQTVGELPCELITPFPSTDFFC